MSSAACQYASCRSKSKSAKEAGHCCREPSAPNAFSVHVLIYVTQSHDTVMLVTRTEHDWAKAPEQDVNKIIALHGRWPHPNISGVDGKEPVVLTCLAECVIEVGGSQGLAARVVGLTAHFPSLFRAFL